MTRPRYPLAWLCYKLGDACDACGCHRLASMFDWVWRESALPVSQGEAVILAAAAVAVVLLY